MAENTNMIEMVNTGRIKKIVKEMMGNEISSLSDKEINLYLLHKVDQIDINANNQFVRKDEFGRWLVAFFSIVGSVYALLGAFFFWIRAKMGW